MKYLKTYETKNEYNDVRIEKTNLVTLFHTNSILGQLSKTGKDIIKLYKKSKPSSHFGYILFIENNTLFEDNGNMINFSIDEMQDIVKMMNFVTMYRNINKYNI